ncbi:hypothetical protein CCASEI_13135 [Corynebacterium casei LMG S-19264]|uniref:Secreted protein n=1 Tax=Corynebacterium casei LMG S-19264 TaxID=1285583 RepID=A0ABN4CJ84_9CORY|nr:hypothetical protein CCASEI_13135 [Corynebacterium casei LMG S-19264]
MTKWWLSTCCVATAHSVAKSTIFISSAGFARHNNGKGSFWRFQSREVVEWSYDNGTTNSNAGKIGD